MKVLDVGIVIIGAITVASAVFVAACMLATRMTFGFRWRALFGIERQHKQVGGLMYVSRAMFFPTAVYWLGGDGWQCEQVAQGIASGELERADYEEAVSSEVNYEAIVRRVHVWPTLKAKELYGKPEDVAP